ncbi:hypothetical protein PBI_MORRISSEY_59 [Gordonia phage Morrissey]|nr:hypothetical protein PBI_MORRISSEY_59 [Gordonia phage Morrissey]
MTTNPFQPDPAPVTINPFTGKPSNRQFIASPNTDNRPGGSASASESTPAAPASEPLLSEEQIKSLVLEGREIKARMDADKDRYAKIKTTLWEGVGRKLGKLPGTSATFRKGASAPRRKVDYQILEEQFPEAYEAAVTVTIPDPENTPGALYL